MQNDVETKTVVIDCGVCDEEPKRREPTRKSEVKLSRFEVLAKQLGLAEPQWVFSKELREFAQQYCDQYFVPEYLLSAWRIGTVWDNAEKPTKLVSDDVAVPDIVEFSDIEGTDLEPSYEPFA